MILNTKIIYVFTVIIVIIAIVLVLVSINPTQRESYTLPTYTPSSEELSELTQPTSSETGRTVTTGSTNLFYPIIEILAYRLRNENVVHVVVVVSATPEIVFNIVEARIDDYPSNHPLYEYTVKKFNNELVAYHKPFKFEFKINILQEYSEEWKVDSIHTLYLKIIIQNSVREIKVEFNIQDAETASKVTATITPV
ncbi:MAG: hypothetical protein QW558_03635 [Desulfurococcaceae archaeon]|uniref:Uncharacterized protein n=1 Tax=Staphylothermus marinus TaxID=2280 RepID=A0A7C4DAY4_STAMA